MTTKPIAHCRTSIRLIATAVLALVLGTVNIPLYGQATCFPPHEGLPLGFIPPTIDGYVEPELSVLTAETVEGGWKRSTRLTYMADTLRPLMVYQAVKDNSQDFIYLSFDVRADETFDDEDVIMIVLRPAFSPAAHSSDEIRLDISPVRAGIGAGQALQSNDTPPVPSGAPSSSAYNIRTNHTPRTATLRKWNMTMSAWGTPVDVTPTENLVTKVRTPSPNLPNSDIAVRSWAPTVSDNGWSVEVKLPTKKLGATGGGTNWLDLTNDFGFFFDVIRVCGNCTMPPPGGGPPVEGGFYNVQYTWPRTAGVIQDPSDFNTVEIPPSWLGEAFMGTNGNCRGVRFENGLNGIGVRNPANPTGPLTTNINAALGANNTFVARITNDGPAAPGVKATFRIANWGIIGDMAAAYDLLPNKLPSGTNVNPTLPVNLPAMAPRTELTVGWQIDAGDRILFKPSGPRDPHQCIWVLLDSNQPVDFADSSVHNNFEFIGLSSHEEDAEISGKGLPPPPSGTDHDFVLNVYKVQLISLADLTRPGGPGINLRSASSVVRGGPANVSDLERQIYENQAASNGVVTSWVWVTDGYRRSGGSLTIGGKKFENYQPVGSFGYAPSHEGRAKDLTYSLTGPGLQQLSNNRYSLKVPDGGVARIHTKLEAVDGNGSPNTGAFKRWGFSLHSGISIPHGNFDTLFNPGPNFGIDLEYRVNPTFSLEGIYGFHHFRGATIGSVTVGNVNVHQFSFNGKVYGSSSPVRPFFNFGGGAYKFDPGSTHGGLNVGGGLQVDVTPTFAVDAMYNFHNVFTSGSSTRFSTAQAGVRFRF